MILEKINLSNLSTALAVAESIFPYELRDGKMSMEDAYLEAIEKDLPNFAYYLAKYDGRVIGITGHYPPEDDSKEIWLGWFGVLPDVRGFGWGVMILRETCKIVATLGVTQMQIYSGDRNEERKAHALYVRNGFLQTGNGEVAGEPVLFFKGPVPLKNFTGNGTDATQRLGCDNCGDNAKYWASHDEAGCVKICEGCKKSHWKEHSYVRVIVLPGIPVVAE